MNRLLPSVLLAAATALAVPVLSFAAQAAPPTARAYAPEDLRELSRNDQVRVISLEYSEQSNGRRIPDDQLRFYLDQVNRSNWGFSRIKQDISQSLAGGGYRPEPPIGGGGNIRCESDNGRPRTCPTPWSGSSRLVRQLSDTACIEGRTWQSQRGQVYVSGGCRGEFAAGAQVLPPIGSGNIRCESEDNRSRTCRTPWSGESRLVRQLSDSPCIEGRSWQSQRGQVYVSGGCRGEFAQGYGNGRPPIGGGDTIRCESTDGRSRTCNTPWRGRSRLVRQLSSSPCIEGRSWQSRGNQVYVSEGCRGEFASRGQVSPGYPGNGSSYSVTCASNNRRQTSCAWDSRYGRPYLQRQLSDTPCRENSTWGYGRNAVWVSNGCRALFAPR